MVAASEVVPILVVLLGNAALALLPVMALASGIVARYIEGMRHSRWGLAGRWGLARWRRTV
jgi:hypothetical protein